MRGLRGQSDVMRLGQQGTKPDIVERRTLAAEDVYVFHVGDAERKFADNDLLDHRQERFYERDLTPQPLHKRPALRSHDRFEIRQPTPRWGAHHWTGHDDLGLSLR